MPEADRYPLAPGLVREWTVAGRWLFRWRSYLPLAVLAYLLLLEVGFLAIFLTSGSRIVVWLYRLLLFRFLFLAGVVKVASGDPTWRDKAYSVTLEGELGSVTQQVAVQPASP